jgi:S-formylglutathione hydrolase FrmB
MITASMPTVRHRRSGSVLLAVVLTLSSGCKTKEVAPQPDHPRLTANVVLRDVAFRSAALNRDMQYRVILPSRVASGQRLPVVCLLHGGGRGFHDWTNDSDVAHFAESGLILVMPEGASSYYANAVDPPQDRYEDYIVSDLISDVENKFPAIASRSSRAIVGISMGGFGAVNLALRHPDLFVFAGGISSAIDVPRREFSIKRLHQSHATTTRFSAPPEARRGAITIPSFWSGLQIPRQLHICF